MSEDEQIAFIKDNYLSLPVKRIANIIGRSGTFVAGRMRKMGLIVPASIIEERKALGRFKKGQVSHNKGLKQSEFMTTEAIERTKGTRFKKGDKPHNTTYDGHISTRVSHGVRYKWIRVGLGEHRLLHRVVWEEHNGPIPSGYNVQFKDGNSLNCDINNLYLIDRNRQAVVNKKGGKSIPYELRETIHIIQSIKAKINA